jgi:hypothetical protein
MVATRDRLKSALGKIARGADPRAPYGNLYRANVRALRGTTRIDVEPDDPAIPPMANIPLKVGVPGLEVELVPGHVVMVGWENRRPDRPYATTWSPGAEGTIPKRTTVYADAVELGGRGGERAVLGDTFMDALNSLLTDGIGPSVPGVPNNLTEVFNQLQAVSAGPLAPLKPFFLAGMAILQLYAQQVQAAGSFLSQVTTTK